MRARMKRRQLVRRLEIVAVVAVVAVSLAVGVYLALNYQGPGHSLDDKPVSQKVYSSLNQTSTALPYGTTNSTYLDLVQNYNGSHFFTSDNPPRPILVYVGADYCPYCAIQRWSLVMALMRFGSFTNLEYMVSGEDNLATFTFSASSYHSSYLVFQPYEVEDNGGAPLATLPSNYTYSFTYAGCPSGTAGVNCRKSYPFLNFADEYVVRGAFVSPLVLGTKNWTQIISSIEAGDSLGRQIKQGANVITAVICKTTGNNPSSVCNSSITALEPTSYTLSSTSPSSELLVAGTFVSTSSDAFIAGRDYQGWS